MIYKRKKYPTLKSIISRVENRIMDLEKYLDFTCPYLSKNVSIWKYLMGRFDKVLIETVPHF